MRTTTRKPHIKSVNSEKNPYMRDDFWASGYFDFLWKKGISKSYQERLDAIKAQAIKSRKAMPSKAGLRLSEAFGGVHQ